MAIFRHIWTKCVESDKNFPPHTRATTNQKEQGPISHEKNSTRRGDLSPAEAEEEGSREEKGNESEEEAKQERNT